MPKTKFVPEKLSNGSFASAGLNDKQFNQLFNRIEKAQKKARRNAKRTLKPSTLTNPTPKALKALGEKAKGQRFTKEDLQRFDKNRQRHKEKYDSRTAGITHAFLVKNSREIDIKRANDQVDDGTGITQANFYAIKGNIAQINVRASIGSKHQNHRVKVRFEQWDELIQSPPKGDYQKAVQLACAGRISFDCDCGRHQYWYRYLATMGNYALAPPKEFAFPKIKNPELSGVACKHVLKATTMLQSLAWQRILATQMKAQAKRVGFGSDSRTHFLSDDEKKAASKNRKTKVNVDEAQRAHKKYERSQAAMARELEKRKRDGQRSIKQARKIRKQSNLIKKQEQQLTAQRDMLRVGFKNFHDGYKLQGKSRDEAVKDYAKMFDVSASQLEKVIK
ncbi:MAG: phage tail protein [Phycisphaeraceae bacterium]|nr:phage tail protein [Phycisphaeraceae bacterium]|tara:strand:+ start:12450 stop:13625 length:1176 start_codon:yes stop_codon:yes gene_type:complete